MNYGRENTVKNNMNRKEFREDIQKTFAKGLSIIDKKNHDYSKCPNCKYEPVDTSEFWGDEPLEWIIANSKTERIFADDLTFGIWVEKSPYYTLCSFCSPCAPGAGDLDEPNQDGVKTYCLGLDYFDSDNPCPYPIYEARGDKLVYEPNGWGDVYEKEAA